MSSSWNSEPSGLSIQFEIMIQITVLSNLENKFNFIILFYYGRLLNQDQPTEGLDKISQCVHVKQSNEAGTPARSHALVPDSCQGRRDLPSSKEFQEKLEMLLLGSEPKP